MLTKGVRFGWGAVTDIGRGGCYIETPQLLPVGSEVLLRLNIASINLEVAAKVVTNHPLVGMGMQFLAIPETEESKFTAMLFRVAEMARES
jgi:Tfp pilus assembly protein PilZ